MTVCVCGGGRCQRGGAGRWGEGIAVGLGLGAVPSMLEVGMGACVWGTSMQHAVPCVQVACLLDSGRCRPPAPVPP